MLCKLQLHFSSIKFKTSDKRRPIRKTGLFPICYSPSSLGLIFSRSAFRIALVNESESP